MIVAQLCLTLCDPPASSVHGISRAGLWSGEPFPSPGDLPDPEIEPSSPALKADSLPFEPPGLTSQMQYTVIVEICARLWSKRERAHFLVSSCHETLTLFNLPWE